MILFPSDVIDNLEYLGYSPVGLFPACLPDKNNIRELRKISAYKYNKEDISGIYTLDGTSVPEPILDRSGELIYNLHTLDLVKDIGGILLMTECKNISKSLDNKIRKYIDNKANIRDLLNLLGPGKIPQYINETSVKLEETLLIISNFGDKIINCAVSLYLDIEHLLFKYPEEGYYIGEYVSRCFSDYSKVNGLNVIYSIEHLTKIYSEEYIDHSSNIDDLLDVTLDAPTFPRLEVIDLTNCNANFVASIKPPGSKTFNSKKCNQVGTGNI